MKLKKILTIDKGDGSAPIFDESFLKFNSSCEGGKL